MVSKDRGSAVVPHQTLSWHRCIEEILFNWMDCLLMTCLLTIQAVCFLFALTFVLNIILWFQINCKRVFHFIHRFVNDITRKGWCARTGKGQWSLTRLYLDTDVLKKYYSIKWTVCWWLVYWTFKLFTFCSPWHLCFYYLIYWSDVLLKKHI